MDREHLRGEIQNALDRQVADVPIPGVEHSMSFPAPHMPADRAEGLAMTAQYMTTFGMVITQAALVVQQAYLACPVSGACRADDLINHMRSFTHGAEADEPAPLTALAYLARVVTGDDVLQKHPHMDTVIEELESWANGLDEPNFSALRELYASASELTSQDLSKIGDILTAVKREMGEGVGE